MDRRQKTIVCPTSVGELEEALARPSAADAGFLRELEGDILILGAAGKMGPSLARLCRRVADEAGTARRVMAVSRRPVGEAGIEAHRWLVAPREDADVRALRAVEA